MTMLAFVVRQREVDAIPKFKIVYLKFLDDVIDGEKSISLLRVVENMRGFWFLLLLTNAKTHQWFLNSWEII